MRIFFYEEELKLRSSIILKTYIWFFAILSNSTQVKTNADKEKFALKVSQRGSNNKYNSVKVSIIQKN